MDTATRHELRLLRSRAYGPGADIDQDPDAVRRLHELEGLLRAPVPETPGAVAAPADDIVEPEPFAAWEAAIGRSDEPTPERPEVHTDAEAPGDRKARSPRRLSRGIRVVWVITVVAAAAAAAAATYALTSFAPVSASSGAPQIATLEPAPMVEVPSGWFGSGPSSRAWEFYGLTLFETAGGFAGSGGTECFAAVATEDLPAETDDQNNWSISGAVYSGCRIGAFPATIELMTDSNAPEELRSRFPDSALQFVKDGDRIGVFLDGEELSESSPAP